VSDRIRLIEHGIVLQDLSGLTSPHDGLPFIEEARAFMERQARGETLVLTDVAGSTFNPEVIDAMKALAEHHKPWVLASALVGLTPIMRIVYRAVVALTRREIFVCETRAEGVAYLLAKRSALSARASSAGASPKKP
jgi:hypothetical protein